MQTAFSAGQYQTYMGNIESRPYWQYSAVNDWRTRAAHAAMSGLIYRYDDPFWSTFYPPNGYNCRCSVTALADRDIDRRGLIVGQSTEDNFIETNKIYNKKGDSYPTKAYKAPDGTIVTTDRGFDYNAGRMNYRPDLDRYDRPLAQAFAKSDMNGAEFKASLKQLKEEVKNVKDREGIGDKASNDEKITIRNTLSRELKFAAGMLSKESQQAIGTQRGTVWLSDDTLVKQISSRENQNFDDYYAVLPDVIYEPDYIFDDKNSFTLVKRVGNKILLAALKHVTSENEIFVQSYRVASERNLEHYLKTTKVVKAGR